MAVMEGRRRKRRVIGVTSAWKRLQAEGGPKNGTWHPWRCNKGSPRMREQGRGRSERGLILAKAQMDRRFVSHGILHELAMTVWAQVVALTLVNLFTHIIRIFIVKPFENLVKFQEVIAIVIGLFAVDRIHLGLNLKPNHVAEFITAKDSLTAITRKMNHPAILHEGVLKKCFGGQVDH